jgi:hypothetical protein
VESLKVVAQGMKCPWISLESKEHDFLQDNYIEKRDATPFSLIKLWSLSFFDYLIQKQLFAMLYTLDPIRYFNKVFLTCDSIKRY